MYMKTLLQAEFFNLQKSCNTTEKTAMQNLYTPTNSDEWK